MRNPFQYKRHWMSRIPQYQIASDMSKIQNILSTAFDCQEYIFGKDSDIRKTEKSSSGTRPQHKLYVRILELCKCIGTFTSMMQSHD